MPTIVPPICAHQLPFSTETEVLEADEPPDPCDHKAQFEVSMPSTAP